MTTHVYTIGHSLHSWERFRELLAPHTIEVIVDVRSKPFSGRAPHFSAEPLRRACAEAGLKYLPMGESLGGRTTDPTLLVEGRVDYERVARTAVFQQGITRLLEGSSKYVIALMCSEKNPLECHRTLLVARHLAPLLAPDGEVRHLLADGTYMTHAQAERELQAQSGMEDGPDLFEPNESRLSRAYARRAREVAWVVRDGDSGQETGESA